MDRLPANQEEYGRFLAELKQRIGSARITASRSVNKEMILLYWDIGQGIMERQERLGWGESVVERLSKDLKSAFPDLRGFAPRSLWNMRRFYVAYAGPQVLPQVVAELAGGPKSQPHSELPRAIGSREPRDPASSPEEPSRILQQVVAEVPWSHHLLLLDKVPMLKARFYYLRATAQLGWSRNVLLNQIKAQTYERALAEKKTHNFELALPEALAEQADEALKSRYNLEFLGLAGVARERHLESRLVERLRDFILELGYGFCFVGRQYRLTLGENEYFVDLLFYHRYLKALVAVELKVGRFEPEYAGKMDFYLNVLNDREKAPEDNPSIGIILCAEKDDVVVEFSLKTKVNPIGVAEYRLVSELPSELRGKLPSESELRKALLPGGPEGVSLRPEDGR